MKHGNASRNENGLFRLCFLNTRSERNRQVCFRGVTVINIRRLDVRIAIQTLNDILEMPALVLLESSLFA